jgi:hypothetical protein
MENLFTQKSGYVLMLIFPPFIFFIISLLNTFFQIEPGISRIIAAIIFSIGVPLAPLILIWRT